MKKIIMSRLTAMEKEKGKGKLYPDVDDLLREAAKGQSVPSDVGDEKTVQASSFKGSLRNTVQASASKGLLHNDEIVVSHEEFLDLQKAHNVFLAAYKEVIDIALKANTWIDISPALGFSPEEIQEMFRSPPSPGMRVELSVETAVIPISPSTLISIMFDMEKWASTFIHIVYSGSVDVPPRIWKKLCIANEAVGKIMTVTAELTLPTLMKTHKFSFMRCLREIIPDIWAIVDVSIDYLKDPPDVKLQENCLRRPSGLIVRSREHSSEVIWVENMQLPVYQQHNIYSNIINSSMAFCAKRWVTTLKWWLDRCYSRLRINNIGLSRRAHCHLLDLAEYMKSSYLDLIDEAPDEGRWVTLSKVDATVLRNVRNSKCYMAVTKFRVQAKPLAVFHFLANRNIQLQWSSVVDLMEPQEVLRSVPRYSSNCITVHSKVVHKSESKEELGYVLQETSPDEFLSFTIASAVMTQLDVNDVFEYGRPVDALSQTSGFAILADGSNASLVTFVMRTELDILDDDQVVDLMATTILTMAANLGEEAINRQDN